MFEYDIKDSQGEPSKQIGDQGIFSDSVRLSVSVEEIRKGCDKLIVNRLFGVSS
jgi:hypothetical protein